MQKSVEVISRNQILRGMLHIPDINHKKVPLAIIFHGFCGNKMGPHFIFVKLARLLESIGIASLRVDFAGSGESDGNFIDMTMDSELEDAKNILDYAKKLEFVAQEKIGILGLSMGGAIAGMIAGDRKDDIKTLCLWAPAGNMGEIILEEHYIGDKYNKFIEQGYFDAEGLLVGSDFVKNSQNIKIYEKAVIYDKKALIIHGDKDDIVLLSASEKYIEIFGQRSELKIIKGANHTFDKKEWEEQVISYSLDFLQEQLV